ncbi:MAG: ACP phosphodiesterase [Bacteroidota bacterium]
MNYLAHAYLSGNSDYIMVGNFIADFIKGSNFEKYPDEVAFGIILHRKIDLFTDTHPTVSLSKQKFFGEFRHFSSVIVDIVYDHFLAVNWSHYNQIDLADFIEKFYQALQNNMDILPANVKRILPYMLDDNWLLSYQSVEGIHKILYQMNKRSTFVDNLHQATVILEANYEEINQEFLVFFQDLQDYVNQQFDQKDLLISSS